MYFILSYLSFILSYLSFILSYRHVFYSKLP